MQFWELSWREACVDAVVQCAEWERRAVSRMKERKGLGDIMYYRERMFSGVMVTAVCRQKQFEYASEPAKNRAQNVDGTMKFEILKKVLLIAL